MRNPLAALIITLVVLSAGCSGSESSELLGTEYKDPPEAPEFTLKNQAGEEVSLSDFEGKVVVCLLYTSDAADE